jgi:hypothetical protein
MTAELERRPRLGRALLGAAAPAWALGAVALVEGLVRADVGTFPDAGRVVGVWLGVGAVVQGLGWALRRTGVRASVARVAPVAIVLAVVGLRLAAGWLAEHHRDPFVMSLVFGAVGTSLVAVVAWIGPPFASASSRRLDAWAARWPRLGGAAAGLGLAVSVAARLAGPLDPASSIVARVSHAVAGLAGT